MEEKYDIAVIGSGLGGLVCANILSKEGFKVIVLEKNNKFGGNLQCFSRDKRIFDTGVHYIGGLGNGEPLYKVFDYLGIMKNLKLRRMSPQYDLITFDNDLNEYPFSQGKDNFVKALLSYFPQEKKAIEKYLVLLDEYSNIFPLHHLENKEFLLEESLELMEKKAQEVIASISENKELQAVLAGVNFLYAGTENTPFYVHALSVNSYIQSAWRCINGGSQIAKLLVKEIKKYGGKVLKNTEIEEIYLQNEKAEYIITSTKQKIQADKFISNIDAQKMLGLLTGTPIKKSYQNRITQNKDTISSFSLFLTLKSNVVPYRNYNYYHFKDKNKIWKAVDYAEENWPENYMISFCPKTEQDHFAGEMTILTYMKYDEVKEWEHTHNTITQKSGRGETYEVFKKRKAEQLLQEVEKKFPEIRQAIQAVHISTPLTYRDYNGTSTGGMYGFSKNAENPLQSFLLPKTKIKNLLLTGQSVSLHGIYGVTMGALLTCSEILDKKYLLQKINS